MKILVESGNLDSHGDQIIVEGIKHLDTVLVTENYSPDKVICEGRIYKENGGLYVECNMPEKYKGWFPGLGFSIVKRNKNVIEECRVVSVGISNQPNADLTIPAIS